MITYKRGKLYFTGEDWHAVLKESRRLKQSPQKTVNIMLMKGIKLMEKRAKTKESLES
jgi:hypothetical protein